MPAFSILYVYAYNETGENMKSLHLPPHFHSTVDHKPEIQVREGMKQRLKLYVNFRMGMPKVRKRNSQQAAEGEDRQELSSEHNG